MTDTELQRRKVICEVACDVNIENDGLYVMADEKCYCKITNGQRAEKYPWEEED